MTDHTVLLSDALADGSEGHEQQTASFMRQAARPGSVLDLVLARANAAVANVVPDRVVEEHRVLGDHRHRLPQGLLRTGLGIEFSR